MQFHEISMWQRNMGAAVIRKFAQMNDIFASFKAMCRELAQPAGTNALRQNRWHPALQGSDFASQKTPAAGH
ncbi:MAG: hypothetical protein ABI389_16570 [Rhodanobacter sp.]